MVYRSKIVSLVVMVCFLMNVTISNVSFGMPVSSKISPENLSTASINNSLMGIQHKDIGKIKIALQSNLRAVFPKKILDISSKDIFNPADMQFFFNEPTALEGGKKVVMCRIKDNYGVRTYYAVFASNADEDGNFPIIGIYTEDEYENNNQLTETIPERQEKDKKAIDRYVQHEMDVDAVIRYAHENNLVVKPSTGVFDLKRDLPELLDELNVTISNPESLTPIEEREVYAVNLERLPDEMQKKLQFVTLADDEGNEVMVNCQAHSSDNAIHIFMPDEETYSVIAGKWAQRLGSLTRGMGLFIFKMKLTHEIGAICGLPVVSKKYVDEEEKEGENLHFAQNELDRRLLASRQEKKKPTDFERLNLNIVDLDTNLLTRDYAMGKWKFFHPSGFGKVLPYSAGIGERRALHTNLPTHTAVTKTDQELLSHITVTETEDEMGSLAAKAILDDIEKTISEKDRAVMLFASAPSQHATWKHLIALWKALPEEKQKYLSESIIAFHMDEYIGLPEDVDQLFGKVLRERVFTVLGIRAENIYYFDDRIGYETAVSLREAIENADDEKISVLTSELEAKVQAHAEKLTRKFNEYGGVFDIVMGGIGKLPHVAFNDPPEAKFNDPEIVKLVRLTETSRQQQVDDGEFKKLSDVPMYALTFSLTPIFSGRHIHIMVPREFKAESVRRTFDLEISEDNPASGLRLPAILSNVRFYLDKEAASKSRVAQLASKKVMQKMAPLEEYKELRNIWKRIGALAVTTTKIMSFVYSPGIGEIAKLTSENENIFNDLVDVEKRGDASYVQRSPEKNLWIVSDGSAVLGLGNIGFRGAGPVMEGKQALLKWFGDVEANILLVDTGNEWDKKDLDGVKKKILDAIRKEIKGTDSNAVIMLEDIASPACYGLEDELNNVEEIPTIHDDQHGTAITIAAAVINAAKLSGRSMEEMVIVVNGAGASAVATMRLLKQLGVGSIIAFDSKGPLNSKRQDLDKSKQRLLDDKVVKDFRKDIKEALEGATGFVGLSKPKCFYGKEEELLSGIAKDGFVFACSNPYPEFNIQTIQELQATSLSNIKFIGCGPFGVPGVTTLNNCYAFPGVFRALVDAKKAGLIKGGIVPYKVSAEAAQALASMLEAKQAKMGLVLPPIFSSEGIGGYDTAITQALSTKVWEYLASGTPLANSPYNSLPEDLNAMHEEMCEVLIKKGLIAKEMSATTDLARQAGLEIPTHPNDRYTLLMTHEFFANGELEDHKQIYGDRFNIDSISAKTHYQFVDKVMAKAKGIETRTVVLVPREMYGEDLQRLLDAGIRFIRVDVDELLQARAEDDKTKRMSFQQNTYVAMLLARAITSETPEDSPIYRLLQFYLKSHFELSDISAEDYIAAISRGDMLGLIKAVISYRPVKAYDLPEYDQVSRTLISA